MLNKTNAPQKYLISLSQPKSLTIQNRLGGYWRKDEWDLYDTAFDGFPQIEKHRVKCLNKRISFDMFSGPIKDEVKYFCIDRLEQEVVGIPTIFYNYQQGFGHLSHFIETRYSGIRGISEIPIKKAVIELRAYLAEQNALPKKNKYTSFAIIFFKRLYDFYNALYDERDEFEKDIWDTRKIQGAAFALSGANYYLNFSNVPKVYRPLTQRLMKNQISSKSLAHCEMLLRATDLFFAFFVKARPEWKDLKSLSRMDMEEYLLWLRKYKEEKGWKNATLTQRILGLRQFLEKIQLYEYAEAPEKPFFTLIFPEDIPVRDTHSSTEIKHIPDEVLIQLEDNMEFLRPYAAPTVILLRATGWRISDIFNLRYDSCLEKTEQGWYLVGDLPKTKVLGHRVPITEEVAALVHIFIREAMEKRNNSHKYLFSHTSGTRKGLPPTRISILRALNELAVDKNITDNAGKIFKFGNHAFRHTKGVELINNGMNILHVQKWLGHASPSMTMRYAKILDHTMRKSWEEAIKNGLFRIDRTGSIKKVDMAEIDNEDVIEWEYIRHNLDAVRMPLGYCMKPKKMECSTQLNPCLTCHNLCTTPEFIPQFELEIMETREIIKKGQTHGRTVWVEKNRALLERLMAVSEILKRGKVHHKIGKRGREYLGDERDNVETV